MSSQTVRVVGKIKVIIATIATIVAIVGYYSFTQQSTIIRVGILITGLLIAICLTWSSIRWNTFISFAKEAVRETKKVIWPTRKEATQITVIVFIFVLIMAIFLWSTDKLFEFLLYDVILIWK